jgi:uncharacterized membrane protein
MSDQQTSVPEKRSRRGILLWSLALNLFLICGIGAYVVSSAFHHGDSFGKGGPVHQFERLASRLPAADASILRTEFAKRAKEIEDEHQAAHRTRDAVRQALGAEPYNAEATRQAMGQAWAAHVRLNQVLQDVIASAAEKMTQAGRSELADFQPGPPRR